MAIGIRTGQEYLSRLQDDREVWLHGRQVVDVTKQPGLMRAANTLAGFFDRQHLAQTKETLTFKQNENLFAVSHLTPKSVDDVLQRGAGFYEWAKWSFGMFGRTPDYKNTSLMAMANAHSYFYQSNPEFADNIRNFQRHVMNNDLVMTHSLLSPPFNYNQLQQGKYSEELALKVVRETDAGIIVRGARLLATLGPLADEIAILPSGGGTPRGENDEFSFAFAIPVNTKGLKIICRDSYDDGKSNFDAPLASRYEEMDATVIFDDVLVPWERVFLYRDYDRCTNLLTETNAMTHMMHQVICGKLAKTEFLVGLLCAIAQAIGKDKDNYVKGLISEAICTVETLKALRFSAETQAKADKWGVHTPLKTPMDTARILFPKIYPRLIELVQIIGSSSLMTVPCELDFENDIQDVVQHYFKSSHSGSKDKTALFRLANDVAVSAFGARQTLYERFFFGPPNVLAARYYDSYEREPLIENVHLFLKQTH